MSDSQARLPRDVYDYDESEEPHPSGRRRRPVADWGVGDDAFEHMPRRRFTSHASEGPPRASRFGRAEPASPDEATEPPEPEDLLAEPERADEGARARRRPEPESWLDDDPELIPPSVARGAPARDDEADNPRHDAGEIPKGHVDDGRRTIVIGRDEDVPSEIAAITADRDLGDEPEPEPPIAPNPPAERRTVRIDGRPEGALANARNARFHDGPRRGRSRPASERLGPRPERLAAWAFALGLLLILIAILTAH